MWIYRKVTRIGDRVIITGTGRTLIMQVGLSTRCPRVPSRSLVFVIRWSSWIGTLTVRIIISSSVRLRLGVCGSVMLLLVWFGMVVSVSVSLCTVVGLRLGVSGSVMLLLVWFGMVVSVSVSLCTVGGLISGSPVTWRLLDSHINLALCYCSIFSTANSQEAS